MLHTLLLTDCILHQKIPNCVCILKTTLAPSLLYEVKMLHCILQKEEPNSTIKSCPLLKITPFVYHTRQ